MTPAEFVADARKAVAGLTVAAAALTAQGLVSGTVEHVVTGVLGAAAAFLAVYSTPRGSTDAVDDTVPASPVAPTPGDGEPLTAP